MNIIIFTVRIEMNKSSLDKGFKKKTIKNMIFLCIVQLWLLESMTIYIFKMIYFKSHNYNFISLNWLYLTMVTYS